jgi:hypothetical protein
LDLPSIITELQLRGFDQDRVDKSLRCMVHVYAVQDFTTVEGGGALVDDIVYTYPLEVVQAASELFLEKFKRGGREAFRVKWGCEETAKMMQGQLWDYASAHWKQFLEGVDQRYLGFFMPKDGPEARIVTTWKVRSDLKWFSVEVPQYGWNVLRLIDDVVSVASRLDLAFGFRPFGPDGVLGERVLLHEQAYATLQKRAVAPPDELLKGIRLWKFFSEYVPEGTDVVALIKDCELTLDDVVEQVGKYFEKGLTSQYRDGQYPPYFINPKKKKEFQAEVRTLLYPMQAWLAKEDSTAMVPAPTAEAPASGDAGKPVGDFIPVPTPRKT